MYKNPPAAVAAIPTANIGTILKKALGKNNRFNIEFFSIKGYIKICEVE